MAEHHPTAEFIGWMADRLAAKSITIDGDPWTRADALDYAKQVFDGTPEEDRGETEDDAHELIDTDMSYWEAA